VGRAPPAPRRPAAFPPPPAAQAHSQVVLLATSANANPGCSRRQELPPGLATPGAALAPGRPRQGSGGWCLHRSDARGRAVHPGCDGAPSRWILPGQPDHQLPQFVRDRWTPEHVRVSPIRGDEASRRTRSARAVVAAQESPCPAGSTWTTTTRRMPDCRNCRSTLSRVLHPDGTVHEITAAPPAEPLPDGACRCGVVGYVSVSAKRSICAASGDQQ
jgi:hypothetical protein